ncbi:hypothetical protein TWF569_011953 [Orbilia oligospora]|uniref:Uncharacterized protein n=1 Tax=Orbilia oligospora TaxID=2813651 RepID=A0A7C8IYE1_ORBOL|nr:hypothetical protein TWF102_001298 [Orbilia oligospora]KAF3084490.1 hypothetical protein TWF103_002534 [Orbilia oligospora]KAF3109069.1 hypothetical protein TWF706_011988 [Orbilia oligospora]KAF3124256.1 hypothetical protein TWF569_011953 [Orbilia oligospora]
MYRPPLWVVTLRERISKQPHRIDLIDLITLNGRYIRPLDIGITLGHVTSIDQPGPPNRRVHFFDMHVYLVYYCFFGLMYIRFQAGRKNSHARYLASPRDFSLRKSEKHVLSARK